MIASQLNLSIPNSPFLCVLCALRGLCVDSFSSRRLAAQPISFPHSPQSHLLLLTARHSCALHALSEVEGNGEKHSFVANPFRIRTSAKRPCKPFRFRTSKTQRLKSFRMRTYKKRGVGAPWLASKLARFRQRQVPVLPCRLYVQPISEARHEA